MDGWLRKSRRNCLILALILNTIALILVALIAPHLWFWKVQNETLVIIYWFCMYPILTYLIYRYFRWKSSVTGKN